MKLLPNQVDEASLSRFGKEAQLLLENRDFQTLAARFGYALAYGRDPATAIEEEFLACIAQSEFLSSHKQTGQDSITVKYFKPDDSNFYALLECYFITSEGCPLLAELIVTSSGEDKHLCLEQVSLA